MVLAFKYEIVFSLMQVISKAIFGQLLLPKLWIQYPYQTRNNNNNNDSNIRGCACVYTLLGDLGGPGRTRSLPIGCWCAVQEKMDAYGFTHSA